MINVTINEVEYQLKQLPSEFTIGEFEKVSSIINNEQLDKIDKYSQLFNFLGIPQEIIDDLDTKTFFEIISKFNDTDDDRDYLLEEKVKSIEIKGRTYQSYEGDEFKMNVKQMKFIEKYVKSNPNNYIGDLMAIIFKDVDLTNNEHYVDAHIKHKSNLIRENITADIALPYLGFFSKELFNNYKLFSKL